MFAAYAVWLIVAVIMALFMPVIVLSCSTLIFAPQEAPTVGIGLVCALVFGYCFSASLKKHFGKLVGVVERAALEQSQFIESLSAHWVVPAIAISAALGLFLELSVIRWQASELEFYSFYKNFGLLSCFAGLGVGYVLSSRKGVPLCLVAPLLALQQAVVVLVRHAFGQRALESISKLPILEQARVGEQGDPTILQFIAIYFTVTTLIVLTMLSMVPLGQLCGQLMSRLSSVKSYGWNLLGSLGGILLMVACSAVLAPPSIWFAIVFLVLIAFSLHSKPQTWAAVIAAFVGTTALCWQVEFGSERVYSPYQILERDAGTHGWSDLKAAGLYYQHVMDLSPASRKAFPELERSGRYYDFPYQIKQAPNTVAVFGAGMGNDVAAALRNGAQEVDAIEIDPCIAEWGKKFHPEEPYKNPKVHLTINDARAFLRQSEKQYDMIVFGLLDSHALAGHGSSLRIDSYVYTLESFKECRKHLKPNGVVCVSFSMPTVDVERKLCKMMTETFDGKMPLCAGTDYDCAISFVQNKEGTLTPDLVKKTGFLDVSPLMSKFDGLDVSTDDWPFIYMGRRVWPVSFLPMLALLGLLTYALNRSLAGKGALTPSTKNIQFALLGAGFMLIEAKAITQLGLNFGNTWQVTAVIIASVLLLGFFGNLAVERKYIQKPVISYALLMVALAAGYYISLSAGGFPSTLAGNLEAIAVLIGPVIFSGMTFSLLITDESNIGNAMSWNLLGAILGGLLEYTAMYLGYRALYVVAFGIYGSAFLLFLKDQLKLKALASGGCKPSELPNK